MKTKISIFITTIALLFCVTATFAQGTQAYFKKNGATVFQSPIADIDSIIFMQTPYLDVDWNTNVITGYDENTGAVNIQYQGTPPAFIENKVIVLPQEYGYDIRVIQSSTVSGNTVTLQTGQGNMSNLFMNTSFTLSTDPSLSSFRSSDGRPVITPSEIGMMTESGYKVIYRKNELKSSNDYGASFDIFSFYQDYTGTELYHNWILGYSASWDKCVFDIGLKGVFSFDFGKTIENSIPIGDLKTFEFYLDGHLNIDLLLKFLFTSTVSGDLYEGALIPNLLGIEGVTFKFMVGSVPVFITVKSDLNYGYSLSAESQISISTGCNIQANLKAGLIYNKGVDVQPIAEFTPSFTAYEPVYTGSCAVQAKASIYPKIEFDIYKFIGPSVSPKPYLGEEYGEGVGWSDAINYQSRWAKTSIGFDVDLGLDLKFALFGKDITIPVWEGTIHPNSWDWTLYEEPAKIELVSPANGAKVTIDKPIDVSFYVSSYNHITGNYSTCSFDATHGAFVNFETQGNVNMQIVETDANGLATVQWTPKDSNDKLTASIVDKDGNTISAATFTPTYENTGDWVLINGVKWATRNVGEPGTFVQNPEDYGEYYQFNKGTTDFLLYNDYYNSVYANSDSWLPANDPSPSGWRVPTLDEIQKLTNTNYVTYEWIDNNGLTGGKFTDKATGNSIFLPAAGYRDVRDGTLYSAGFDGYYWSSTAGDAYYACGLHFYSGYAYWWGLDYRYGRDHGFSVRSVAD